MKLIEVQIDRLVGPTHHFGGLGVGNVASKEHAGQVSSPFAGALQGLDKMRLVAGIGVPQLILPPQPRPDLHFLRSLGFSGSDADVLRRVYENDPGLLSAAMSCSAMWTANAATVTPTVDGDRSSPTITVANLTASVHRAIEPAQTGADLRHVLPAYCEILEPLAGGAAMRDEGAANHMRLGTGENLPGINVFVYGDGDPKPKKFWPRQTRAACEAIARRHGLPEENTFFLKQHPAAIDAGAFHNDVVALSHDNVLVYHELAFAGDGKTLTRLEQRFRELTGSDLIRVSISNESLPIEEAVRTYLFNSQIVSSSRGNGSKPIILCPMQVKEHAGARAIVDQWCGSGLFDDAHFVALDQSMSGGGGPACLRLRVPLAENEFDSIPSASLWSEELDGAFREVIEDCFVRELKFDDFVRPDYLEHARAAQKKINAVLLGQ